MPSLGVIVGPASAGEFERCAHVLQDLEIIIEAAFGDANFVRAVGGRTGALVIDKVVQPDQAMQ